MFVGEGEEREKSSINKFCYEYMSESCSRAFKNLEGNPQMPQTSDSLKFNPWSYLVVWSLLKWEWNFRVGRKGFPELRR